MNIQFICQKEYRFGQTGIVGWYWKNVGGAARGFGGCSSLVEDDLVFRACDWLLIINNYPAKSRGISPDALRTTSKGELAKIRGYSARLNKIIVLLFNASITKHSFIAEKLETTSILPFSPPTHEITYIAGYLVTMDDEYRVQHNHT